MWYFLWDFMGILMTFGFVELGCSPPCSSLIGKQWKHLWKKYGTIFVVLPPCSTHVTNFHGFGWIRLLWFWNWDVPLLVREKMEPYWKKYETSDGICAWFFQIFWNVLPPLMLPCFPQSRKNNEEKHLNSKTRTNKFIHNHENAHKLPHVFSVITE
jgi:hypothetical protein